MPTPDLQCYDASGNLTFDAAWLPGRFLGIVNTGGHQGSITNAGFANGNGFWIMSGCAVFVQTTTSSGGHYPLIVSLSGNTLTWKYNSPSGDDTNSPASILYGYFP